MKFIKNFLNNLFGDYKLKAQYWEDSYNELANEFNIVAGDRKHWRENCEKVTSDYITAKKGYNRMRTRNYRARKYLENSTWDFTREKAIDILDGANDYGKSN